MNFLFYHSFLKKITAAVAVSVLTLAMVSSTGTAEVNSPPVANPGGPYSATEDQPVTLDGSGSFDPEGNELTYVHWNFGDGSASSTVGLTPDHVYTRGGTYTVTLIVYDGTLQSEPVTTTVTVEEVNDRPLATIGGPYIGASSATEDSSFYISDAGSTDEETPSWNLQRRWDFGDGTTGISTSPSTGISHVYTRSGTYTVTLIVSDGVLDSAPVSTTVEVNEVNDSPVASAGPDQTTFVNEDTTFEGLGSDEEDGSNVGYYWDFGDGYHGNGAVVTHRFSMPGVYTVVLRVNDSLGMTATDSLTVTVVTDIVSITSATYSKSKGGTLRVEATSSRSDKAQLTVNGFNMTYDPALDVYQYTRERVSNPGTVLVESSLGGSDTESITVVK